MAEHQMRKKNTCVPIIPYNLVPVLATRCFYGGTSELRSTGPHLVLVLATRCLYKGVHLTEGQPDPKADQMSS